MIYENIDLELLDFLHDPLVKLDTLNTKKSHTSIITHLLCKIPVLRNLMNSEQTQLLIREKLKEVLWQAKKALPQHIYEDSVILNKNTAHRFTEKLNKYFRIEVDQPISETNPEKAKLMLHIFTQQHIFASAEYTCNRISENLKLYAKHNLSLLDNSELWLSYYLSEIYFLMTHGLMIAKFKGAELHIKPSIEYQQRLKALWLSEVMEENSKLSDMHFLKAMSLQLKTLGHLDYRERESITNYILDKCLSIHTDYLSIEVAKHPTYQYLREIVYFAAHLEMRLLSGEHLTSSAEILVYVSPATASMINTLLIDSSPTVNSPSSFAEYKNNSYIRGQLSFKYGLRKLTAHLLKNITNKKKKNNNTQDFGQILGDGIEKDYITKYLEKLGSQRFKLHKNLEPNTNAEIKGYDIDLILQDIDSDIYYFIQIKHSLSEIPIYLSEQCRIFLNGNFYKGFSKQLAILKDKFTDDSIRKKLHSQGLSGAHEHNSYFILLHNIPFLNFYELNGIFFYEWNLFRNILNDGRIQFIRNEQITRRHILNKPKLHQPKQLVDAYLNNAEHGEKLADNYDIYSKARAKFIYRGLKINCKII